ncbi:MAG: formate/nitrite transporter family protein [Clostridium sp.]|nr:formate/nitrite transporter family protein [Clostridium sp.]
MNVRTPAETAQAALASGTAKAGLHSRPGALVILSILAGCYIALGGTLSLIAGYGFPEATAGNPSLQRLISGATFPLGLILVVVLGAELFTGNNALLIPPMVTGQCSPAKVAANWTVVYFGNMAGAVLFTWLFVDLTGLTAADPYNSAILGIARAKVSMSWLTVLLKGIGANWCVCLAVWLALSGKTLTDKMAACWFPVMAFVALGYEHSVANMFYLPCAMMAGSDVTILEAVNANLIPATLGNIVGGALFVGSVHAWLYLKK